MLGKRSALRIALCPAILLWSIAAVPQANQANETALVNALRNADPRVRRNAVEALGGLGKEAAAAIPDLVLALNDRDMDVRWGSAVALGKIGSQATASLIRALGDASVNVRLGAALALGRMEPRAKEALAVLIVALNDREGRVRENAAEALGLYGPDGAAVRTAPISPRRGPGTPTAASCRPPPPSLVRRRLGKRAQLHRLPRDVELHDQLPHLALELLDLLLVQRLLVLRP